MSSDAPILIVGAGQSGATAAAALRSSGLRSAIVMIGSEVHLPYERPPLSKPVLADAAEESKIFIRPASFYAESNIDLRVGTTVTAIDPVGATARCSDGQLVSFSRCLLATGGSARVLASLPPATPRVHYLRSLDDARGLRQALRNERSLLVIGGGFLGLEAASTARAMGCSVTVLESAPRVLQRAAPAALSLWLEQRIRNAGIDLRLGSSIASATSNVDGLVVTLENGETLSAPLGVVAIGMTPNVALAASAGLALHPINGGIEIDANCRTSAANIFAAGDCSSQFQSLFERTMRLESWHSANEQARIAAAAMLGSTTEPAAVPWFWTDQFGCNIQMLGAADPTLHYVTRGRMADLAGAPQFLLLGTRDHCVRHAVAVNGGGDLRQLRNLIHQRTTCDIARLCDTSVPLRQAVKDALARAHPVTP